MTLSTYTNYDSRMQSYHKIFWEVTLKSIIKNRGMCITISRYNHFSLLLVCQIWSRFCIALRVIQEMGCWDDKNNVNLFGLRTGRDTKYLKGIGVATYFCPQKSRLKKHQYLKIKITFGSSCWIAVWHYIPWKLQLQTSITAMKFITVYMYRIPVGKENN